MNGTETAGKDACAPRPLRGAKNCEAVLGFNAMLMLCPICAGEFEAVAGVCSACGCALVPSTMGEDASNVPESAPTKDVELVELCRPRSHPEAMLIKATLEQNHVAVTIRGAHSISVMPYLAFGGQLRVLVSSRQFAYARELYKAYFENDDGTDYIAEE